MRVLHSRASRQRVAGFTLLELLVAMSIMAIGVALIYRVAGGNVRNHTDLAHRQQALELAESLLNEHSVVAPGPLALAGQVGVVDWQVSADAQPVAGEAPDRPRLRELHVRLSWPTSREPGQLQLQAWVPEFRPPAAP